MSGPLSNEIPFLFVSAPCQGSRCSLGWTTNQPTTGRRSGKLGISKQPTTPPLALGALERDEGDSPTLELLEGGEDNGTKDFPELVTSKTRVQEGYNELEGIRNAPNIC